MECGSLRKTTGYSATQIILHWACAALMIYLFVGHDGMQAAWSAMQKGNPAAGGSFAALAHAWGGTVVLVLALWLLGLRFSRGVPDLPDGEPPLLRFLAGLTHATLYGLMIVLPVTGIATWFGGVEFTTAIHDALKLPLLAFFLLHVLGALYQHFWLRTCVLVQMLRPVSAPGDMAIQENDH